MTTEHGELTALYRSTQRRSSAATNPLRPNLLFSSVQLAFWVWVSPRVMNALHSANREVWRPRCIVGDEVPGTAAERG
jgi:hypothetical protein